jgi:hypothetical protein
MAGRLEETAAAFDRAHQHNPYERDRWPDEPSLLSPWEADCQLALLGQTPPRPAPGRAPAKAAKVCPAKAPRKAPARRRSRARRSP